MSFAATSLAMQPQIALHSAHALVSTPTPPLGHARIAAPRDHAGTGISRKERPVGRPTGMPPLRSSAQEAVLDDDYIEELNLVSNRTLEAMCAGQEGHAQALAGELGEMLGLLQAEGDAEACRFLRVLRGLLAHTLPAEAAQLQGPYAAAVNRILNQVSGAEWRLTEEGQSAAEEPSFSSWDDVFGGGSGSGGSGSKQAQAAQQSSQPPDTLSYYRRLEIGSDASPAEVKAAYRRLALRLHPDVNAAPDASARFAELSEAYDVLSNSTSRALYDRFGPGMASREGAAAGSGNAREAWDEFKPHVRQNKHTRARAAAASAEGAAADGGAGDGQPQVGDVVEYPLRESEVSDNADGRTHGVGLLVGRNTDRGDAAKLPADRLSLCEVEPLRQEEAASDRWVADELGLSSFARLEEMRVLPVAAFDGKRDVWTITAPLSEGCGGPALPEEVIF